MMAMNFKGSIGLRTRGMTFWDLYSSQSNRPSHLCRTTFHPTELEKNDEQKMLGEQNMGAKKFNCVENMKHKLIWHFSQQPRRFRSTAYDPQPWLIGGKKAA